MLPKKMPETRKEVWDLIRNGHLRGDEEKTLIELFNTLEK